MKTSGYDPRGEPEWTGPDTLTQGQRARLVENAKILEAATGQDGPLTPPQPPADWSDAAAVAEYRKAVRRYDQIVAADIALDAAFGPWTD